MRPRLSWQLDLRTHLELSKRSRSQAAGESLRADMVAPASAGGLAWMSESERQSAQHIQRSPRRPPVAERLCTAAGVLRGEASGSATPLGNRHRFPPPAHLRAALYCEDDSFFKPSNNATLSLRRIRARRDSIAFSEV